MNKNLIIVLAFLGIFANNLYSQSSTQNWFISPLGQAGLVCPQFPIEYGISSSANADITGCRTKWLVEGGVFVATNSTEIDNGNFTKSATVRWNNGVTTGKITFTVYNCSKVASNTSTGGVSTIYYIQSITNETPTTRLNLPLQTEKGRRTVSLSIDAMKIPNTGETDAITSSVYVNQYEWTLPNNRPEWQFIGQPAGTRFIRTNNPTVDIYVDALNGGDVTVRGVVTACTPNNFSKVLALPIQRITPTASPIATTAVAGKVAANGALECGVRDSIVFRSPAPSGLTARRYYWRFTNNTAGYKFVRANGVLKDTAITTTDSITEFSKKKRFIL